MFRDILLPIPNYPDLAPDYALGQAAKLCAGLGGRLCALGIHLRFPVKDNRLANLLVGLDSLAESEERRSLDQAQEGLAKLKAKAEALGLVVSEAILRAELYDQAEAIAAAARTRDLCVTPYLGSGGIQRTIAEAAIFGSGRPVLVFNANQDRPPPSRFERVTVAWDGGRAAARAVADALPLLRAAAHVQVITVLNEKPAAGPGVGIDLIRHLSQHDVTARLVEMDAQGEAIGTVLKRCLATDAQDLLVMGAFGHSRLREFVLGGATQSFLHEPPIPVFCSH